MKKVLNLLVIVFLFSVGAASALDLGNTSQFIKRGQFNTGLQYAYILKQGFEDYDLNRSYSDGYNSTGKKGADFKDDQLCMITITYGIIDRINVFAEVGVVDGGKWFDYEPGNKWKGDLKSNFIWSVGAKGKLYESDNGLGFSLAARYMRYDNREVNDWRCIDTAETAGDLGWLTDDRFDYWKLDVIANLYWKIGAYTPFVGAGYTYYDITFSGKWVNTIPFYGSVNYDASFCNENRFTTLLGLDVDLGTNLKAGIKGTFISSTDLTFRISYNF